jgi:ABC-type uncharacterized transport system involved in gliding motility auxiliary subunit
MKKKQIETMLYSVAGVAAMLVIVLVINFILGAFKQRVDLTHEKLYTLSDGTKRILKHLDGKIEVRFYFSQGEKEMDSGLKSYAQHVEDLLAEYKKAGGGKVQIKKLNPKPDTDAEDSARLDGIEGQMLPTGENLYFGLAISYLDQKVALPALPPARERLLEYDISRAISKVVNPNKPIVGLMTPLPMMGMPNNPMMQRMGQQPQEPWVIMTELQNDFTVRNIPMTADKIDDDVKVLLVVHPKDITDAAQYAIDQFVLRGGKLIAFLDGLSIMDRQQQQNPMMPSMGSSSSLDKLLKVWGVTFENSKVVADRNFTSHFRNPRNGQPEAAPAVLSLKPQGINKDDAVTTQIDSLLVPFAGVFSGTPAAGLKETVLLKTTTDSQLVESFLAQMSGEQISKDFKPSGTVYPIAIRLTGKFKTAFPEGKPKDTEKTEEKKDDAKKDEAKKDEKKPDDSLKESKAENAVVLVGDADMLYDQFCVEIQNFFGQRFAQPRNGNLNLVQNLVEQMAGDENLIAVRSRATLNRPFEKIDAMQAQAEEAFRSKRKELEDSLRETQQKLGELQAAKKDKGQQSMMLSAEQQQEIKKFREKEAQAKIELRQVKKQLKRKTESLENELKWVNIAGMPFLVTAFGLGLAFLKGQRAKKR